jgi:xylulokinase
VLADVFQVPIHMLELKGEATSWGAAVAAGVAIGQYDWSIAAERSQVVEVVEPNAANTALYDELLAIYTASYEALVPIYGRLEGVRRLGNMVNRA